LRAHAQESEPANDAFVAFMDAIEAPEAAGETAERLAGVYRVLKPHLLAVYARHLESANPIYEPPTCRILSRCIEDELRHIGAGEIILRHLASAPDAQARVVAWQSKLSGMLEAARGVTGQGVPPAAGVHPSATPPMSDDANEFIRLERAGEKWSMPEELEMRVRAFGDALVACDGAALGRFLDAAPDAALLLALEEVRLACQQPAAYAKLGRHRIVKYRLEGARGTVTLNARWEQGGRGWRVGALDLVKIEQSQTA
jgi:hypothetical protein